MRTVDVGSAISLRVKEALSSPEALTLQAIIKYSICSYLLLFPILDLQELLEKDLLRLYQAGRCGFLPSFLRGSKAHSYPAALTFRGLPQRNTDQVKNTPNPVFVPE